MKIEITAAVFCLTVAAFFVVLKAQPSALYSQETPPPSDSNSLSVWDGVYTHEQADGGRSIYHDQCAFCHGDTLDGGEEAPPLAGAQFLSNFSFSSQFQGQGYQKDGFGFLLCCRKNGIDCRENRAFQTVCFDTDPIPQQVHGDELLHRRPIRLVPPHPPPCQSGLPKDKSPLYCLRREEPRNLDF